jgi:hypothetical protein
VLDFLKQFHSRENLFFKIMFGWFRKPQTKLEKVG